MDKEATIEQVEKGFDKLLASVQGLDERALTKVFYGDWSVKDILAHISGWHHEMTGSMERMARGERPTPEGVDYGDADRWNAGFVAAMKPQNATTVVADLQQWFANFLRAAGAIGDDRYGEGKTINKILETSGRGHYEEHLRAILEYRAKLGVA